MSLELVYAFFLCVSVSSSTQPTRGTKNGDSASRVYGGKCVPEGCKEYPWFVQIAISQQDEAICGGSLIDQYTIVTAAHCFEEPLKKAGQFVSVYHFNHNQPLRGLIDLRVGSCHWSQTGRALEPAFVHLHPKYQPSPYYSYDAAVIKLVEPGAANVSRFASLFNASDPRHVEGVKKINAQVLGWGITEMGLLSSCLRVGTVDIKKDRKCVRLLDRPIVYYEQEIMLCASGNQIDACQGDSGGPLLLDSNSEQVIAGIVSFGHPKRCAAKGYPTVYTRISAIVPWVESICFYGNLSANVNCHLLDPTANANQRIEIERVQLGKYGQHNCPPYQETKPCPGLLIPRYVCDPWMFQYVVKPTAARLCVSAYVYPTCPGDCQPYLVNRKIGMFICIPLLEDYWYSKLWNVSPLGLFFDQPIKCICPSYCPKAKEWMVSTCH
jgi:trypsin